MNPAFFIASQQQKLGESLKNLAQEQNENRNEENENKVDVTLPSSLLSSSQLETSTNSSPASIQSKKKKNATTDKQLFILQLLSFCIVVSTAMIMFSPTPYMISYFNGSADKASSFLAMLTTISAIVEILFSPIIGSIIDSIGRKSMYMSFLLSIILANGMVAISGNNNNNYHNLFSFVSICLSKVIISTCRGFLTITTQTMISDLCTTASDDEENANSQEMTETNNKNKLSSALGMQMASTGIGFLIGTIASGWISDYKITTRYSISTLCLVGTLIVMKFALQETLLMKPIQKSKTKKTAGASFGTTLRKNLHSLFYKHLLSCTKLLYNYGKDVRLLSILLMLQSFPSNAGDFFQIFCKTDWDLSMKQFSNFVVLISILSIVGNLVGSRAIRSRATSTATTNHTKTFTCLAIGSSILTPLGACLLGYKGLIIGTIIGFLGAAQSLGVYSELIVKAEHYQREQQQQQQQHLTQQKEQQHYRTYNNKDNDNVAKVSPSLSPPTTTTATTTIGVPMKRPVLVTSGGDSCKSKCSTVSVAGYGELMGERTALLALLKIIGPISYSFLYVQGKKLFGINYLPFVVNILLGITAFTLVLTNNLV